MSATPTYDILKPKEKAFVDAFVTNGFNATRAAASIGIKNPRQRGSQMWADCDIRKAVDERLEASGVTPAMVKSRIAEQAFSSLGDCLRFDEVQRDTGKTDPATGDKIFETKIVASLDLNKARRLKKLHLLSKIKQRTYWDKLKQTEVIEVEVENYNAQAALNTLARVFRLLGDSANDDLSRQLKELQLKLTQHELDELEKKRQGGAGRQSLEGRPRPQGGPGVGVCGLYHQALDPEIYPDAPLIQLAQASPDRCLVCGAAPFRFNTAPAKEGA